MKTAFTILFLFAVSLCFGQVKLQPVQAQSAPAADTMANETIEHCDAMIAAIDSKVNHVSSDPAKKAKAEQDGWYTKMAHSRACFVARREELVRRSMTK